MFLGIQDSDNSYLTCLTPFIEKYQTLFELDDNTLDDQEFKRMLEIIGSTLTLLMSQIPINVDIIKVTDALLEISINVNVDSKILILITCCIFLTFIILKITFAYFLCVIFDLFSTYTFIKTPDMFIPVQLLKLHVLAYGLDEKFCFKSHS